jgi:glycosyltransferase involved in cell wall biosynthesis
VLQIGRLDAQKAPDDFVRMAAHVVQAQTDARFYLVGEGPMQAQLEEQVRTLGLLQSITLLGRRNDVPTLLLAADIVTLSSLWEGMPYSLLEAGAMGRPVVCTSVDGSPEVVLDGETGYVVPASDTAAMAEAVLRLIANPNRMVEMGSRARARVSEHFDVRESVARVGKLYMQLMNEGK